MLGKQGLWRHKAWAVQGPTAGGLASLPTIAVRILTGSVSLVRSYTAVLFSHPIFPSSKSFFLIWWTNAVCLLVNQTTKRKAKKLLTWAFFGFRKMKKERSDGLPRFLETLTTSLSPTTLLCVIVTFMMRTLSGRPNHSVKVGFR